MVSALSAAEGQCGSASAQKQDQIKAEAKADSECQAQTMRSYRPLSNAITRSILENGELKRCLCLELASGNAEKQGICTHLGPFASYAVHKQG